MPCLTFRFLFREACRPFPFFLKKGYEKGGMKGLSNVTLFMISKNNSKNKPFTYILPYF